MQGMGDWQFGKYFNEQYLSTGWINSEHINKEVGDWNVVNLTYLNDKILVNINGYYVATVNDAEYSKGKFGFKMYDKNANGTGKFDYVKIVSHKPIDGIPSETLWIPVHGNSELKDSIFSLKSSDSEISSTYYNKIFSDYVLEVNLKNEAQMTGILFNGDPDQVMESGAWLNTYELLLSKNKWKLTKYCNGEKAIIQDWHASNNINDDWNKIKIITSNSVISVYINETFEKYFFDNSFLSGNIGLSVIDNEVLGKALFEYASVTPIDKNLSFSVSGEDLLFMDDKLSENNMSKGLTITNNSNYPAYIQSINISSSSFSLSNDYCSGRIIGHDETCSFIITFTPISSGFTKSNISISLGSNNDIKLTNIAGYYVGEENHILIVPSETYPNVVKAVNDALTNDVIYLSSGNYDLWFNLKISKNLTIVGQNKENTIINADCPVSFWGKKNNLTVEGAINLYNLTIEGTIDIHNANYKKMYWVNCSFIASDGEDGVSCTKINGTEREEDGCYFGHEHGRKGNNCIEIYSDNIVLELYKTNITAGNGGDGHDEYYRQFDDTVTFESPQGCGGSGGSSIFIEGLYPTVIEGKLKNGKAGKKGKSNTGYDIQCYSGYGYHIKTNSRDKNICNSYYYDQNKNDYYQESTNQCKPYIEKVEIADEYCVGNLMRIEIMPVTIDGINTVESISMNLKELYINDSVVFEKKINSNNINKLFFYKDITVPAKTKPVLYSMPITIVDSEGIAGSTDILVNIKKCKYYKGFKKWEKQYPAYSIGFSADNNKISATASHGDCINSEISFWEISNSNLIYKYDLDNLCAYTLSSIDDTFACGGYGGGDAYLYQQSDGSILKHWYAQYDMITSLSFLPEGKMLGIRGGESGAMHATTAIWLSDISKGEVKKHLPWETGIDGFGNTFAFGRSKRWKSINAEITAEHLSSITSTLKLPKDFSNKVFDIAATIIDTDIRPTDKETDADKEIIFKLNSLYEKFDSNNTQLT